MTETGPRQWLVALVFSLFAHLALGFWLDQLPTAAGKIPARSVTVSLTAATSGERGGGQKRGAHAAKKRAAEQSKAAPPRERETSEPISPQTTQPSTKSEPTTENLQRAPVAPREHPTPKPQAAPTAKPINRAAQSPKRQTSAPRPTQSAAAEAMPSAARPSAIAPRPANTLLQTKADGDVAGGSGGLSAAAPAPGNPKPRYPSLARRRGYQGRVLIRAAVRADGRAAQVQIKQSSGHRVLDEAALAAVKDWHFLPARRAGRPVTATVDVPITFRLNDDARSL